MPLVAAVVLCAAGAVLLESQLRIPVKLTGHRAFPGALVLLLLWEALPPLSILVFGSALGAVVALSAQEPLLFLVWAIPAACLAFWRWRAWRSSALFAIAVGLMFGLLRCFALPGVFHHTPEALRLGGHLAFGGLGALVANLALAAWPREDRSPGSEGH